MGTGTCGAHGTTWGQGEMGHMDTVGTKLRGTHRGTSWGQGHGGRGHLGDRMTWDTWMDILGWGHCGDNLGTKLCGTHGCLEDRDMEHMDGRPGDRDTRTSWGQNRVRPIEGHHGDKAVGPTDTLGTGARGTHGWTSWGQGHTGHTDTLGTKLWDTRTDMLGWGHVGHEDGHLGDKAKREP